MSLALASSARKGVVDRRSTADFNVSLYSARAGREFLRVYSTIDLCLREESSGGLLDTSYFGSERRVSRRRSN